MKSQFSYLNLNEKKNPNANFSIKKNRLAVKKLKVHKSNYHEFIAKFFTQPTFCSSCKEFLWGIGKQGYECRLCACVVHKKCCHKISSKCTISSNNSDNFNQELRKGLNFEFAHNFLEKNYYKPTFCDHCGKLLVGLLKQGLQCTVCGFKCHKTVCVNNVPKNCGIKQSAFEFISNFVHDLIEKTENTEIISEIQSEKVFTEDVKISLNDFYLLNVIGVGSFGRVLLVSSKIKKNFYALKVLNKDSVLQNDNFDNTIAERDVLKMCYKNPFMSKIYCSFQNKRNLFFLMEFLNGGDLWFNLFESERFDEERTRFYAAEILTALQFLHNQGIIFRDLKLENIVLDSRGHCKISDFGVCKKIDPDGKAQTFCGTPDYIAPEMIKGELYNFSVDFWSFGILLYEMLIGSSPFNGENEYKLYEQVLNKEIVFSDFMSEQSKSIITMLLERDPERRLGMKTSPHGNIRVHPFFDQIDWIKLEKCEIEPPFKPKVDSPSDLSNFDLDFKNESVCLEEIENEFIKTFEEDVFSGFSFMLKDFEV